MPTATPTTKRNPIPEGEHLLCLVSVEEKLQPDFNDPNKEALRWIWQFKAKAQDPETGERFEYRQYTGPNYGNAKAGLTILLDQMFPKWSDDQKGTIDTDTVLQTYYKARIRHEKPDKAGDPPKPRLVFIEPYVPKNAASTTDAATAAAAPAAAAAAAEERDDFADGTPDPFEGV